MSAEMEDFEVLSEEHNATEPTLYDPYRANCPAHAFYDICQIFPNITSFTKIGVLPDANYTPACPMLEDWFYSEESANWMNNPKTNFAHNLTVFLNNVLNETLCASADVWQPCYDLEYKQKHVGEHPEQSPEPEISPEAEDMLIEDSLLHAMGAPARILLRFFSRQSIWVEDRY